MSSQSSARYEGVSPCSDLKTNIASLKMTRSFTGNQCKRDRTGEMWSHRLVPVRSRAAAFWIDCRRRNSLQSVSYCGNPGRIQTAHLEGARVGMMKGDRCTEGAEAEMPQG